MLERANKTFKLVPEGVELKTYPIEHYYQSSGITCGPASLRMALSTYGLNCSESFLSEICQTGRVSSGTESTDMELGISILGGQVICKNNSTLKEVQGYLDKGWRVLIGFGYGGSIIGHYSVLERVTKDKVIIYDPSKGPNKTYTKYYFEKEMWNLGSHKDGKKLFIAFKF